MSIFQISCNKDFSDHWPYHPPEDINDGLTIGTLEEVNIDTQMILKAVGRIHQGKYKEVHAMLIYKDDRLVFEEYYKGHKYLWNGPDYHGEMVKWDIDSMHCIMSVTKSITSACIGIAINQDYIDHVQESIFNYLPNYQHLNTGGKDKITIEHLLTMTSGLKWNEWSAAHGSSANDIDRIYLECSNDPVTCILEKPLISEPGEKFTYNGGGMIILGEIIKNATDMNIKDFSMKFLFQPLGIDSALWYQFDNGAYGSDGSLYLTPRDMMKFGVLYLKGGVWNTEQLIPAFWVKKSQVPYKNNTGINIPADDSGKNGYAYSWWTNEISNSGRKAKLYQAGGWGGQEIIVFPDDDMVVVFTGGNYAVKKSIYEILERFILPSIN